MDATVLWPPRRDELRGVGVHAADLPGGGLRDGGAQALRELLDRRLAVLHVLRFALRLGLAPTHPCRRDGLSLIPVVFSIMCTYQTALKNIIRC